MLTRLLFVLTLLRCSLLVAAEPPARPNILFLAVDDLRPQLGCYGVEWMQTPHIDALARSAVRFDRHYVQMAVCIPSRVALLTSLRSERTRQVYGPMRWQNVAGARPLGAYFREHGYTAVSLGKIWHAEGEPNGDTFDRVWAPPAGAYASAANRAADQESRAAGKRGSKKKGKAAGAEASAGPLPPITEAADEPDDAYPDGRTAAEAVTELRRLAGADKPFVLAVGFHKPHLPFVAPKQYWDRYDAAKIPLAAQRDFPRAMAPIAFSGHPNFFNYDYGSYAPLVKNSPMPDATARHLIHAYAAAVSFMDAQVGRVLAELERLGLARNTIVVLWGDHGFHLGDVGHWGKQTNFEGATRSPLLIRAPGVSRPGVSSALVETVDIFPTLADLAGLPALPVSDGASLRAWLRDPAAPSRAAAYHVFTRPPVEGSRETTIGFAVRTADARYIEWRSGWSLAGPLVATEYYRYRPGHFEEEENLAADPTRATEISAVAKLLRANPAWQAK
ncbi:MAG: sulfatase [Verrucomicrobiota bacterium]